MLTFLFFLWLWWLLVDERNEADFGKLRRCAENLIEAIVESNRILNNLRNHTGSAPL